MGTFGGKFKMDPTYFKVKNLLEIILPLTLFNMKHQYD